MTIISVSEDDEEAPIIYRPRRFSGQASQSLISVQRSRSWIVAEEGDELMPKEDVESDSQGSEEEEDDEFEAEEVGENSGNEDSGRDRGEAEAQNQQQQITSSLHNVAFAPRSCSASSPVFNNANGAVLQAALTNRNVLDCPICFDPLFAPIFQCENGHIACSLCFPKLNGKCAFCCMSIGIGNNRCRGLEKFIESISSISCKNVKNGCKKTVPYSKNSEHEEMCPHATCNCPHPSCPFFGSSKELYHHFGTQHSASTTPFTFNTTFTVSIDINQKHMFLQEQDEGVIFILNHVLQKHERAFSLDCVGPNTFKKCFIYEVIAESMEASLSLQSVAEIYTRWSKDMSKRSYLTVTSAFAAYSGPLCLLVCIKKCISSEGEGEVGVEVGNEDDGNTNGAVQVVLTHPADVLNCSICLNPLSTPIFQGEKGELACSSCFSKAIGCDKYSRCRGLEEVVGSIRVSSSC